MIESRHRPAAPAPAELIKIRQPVAAQIFRKRAQRLRSLAEGHPFGEYLQALSQLAAAQIAACDEISTVRDLRTFPPISSYPVSEWRHGNDVWRKALRVIIGKMHNVPLPQPARVGLLNLDSCSPERLSSFAEAILIGDYSGIDLAAAPVVGAALQAYWTELASRITPANPGDSRHRCPICCSPPVAAVVAGDSRLRYLACSLCAAEWHYTRLICSCCGSPDELSYFAVDGDSSGAKAEACKHCNSYLKLFYLDESPAAEPLADDVATFALDLLMAEAGYRRGGLNLLLLSPDSQRLDLKQQEKCC